MLPLPSSPSGCVGANLVMPTWYGMCEKWRPLKYQTEVNIRGCICIFARNCFSPEQLLFTYGGSSRNWTWWGRDCQALCTLGAMIVEGIHVL